MYNVLTEKQGWIEVICGSMYSGKSEELIRRLKRALIAKQKISIFKPQIDVRFSEDHIVSHDKNKLEAIMINNPEDILLLAKDADVVGIDEAQFMGMNLINIVSKLANAGKRVIIAGLDMDYRGEPFHPMPELMAIAEDITKTHAICIICGNLAQYTQRLSEETSLIVLGASESYDARCRNHFIRPHKKEAE
jgi:thymidine kinase